MKTDILKLGFGQNPTRRTDPTSAPIFTWKVLIYNKKNKAVACPRPPNVIRCLTFVPMILTSENWFFFLVCWFPKVSRILSLDVTETLQYSVVLIPKICGFLSW